MGLRLENVGIIKQADVALNGLTVIAGENDTGKSTVGRMMFAIVKAINRYKQDLNENKGEKVFHKIEDIFFTLRRHYNFAENDQLWSQFQPQLFFSGISSFLEGNNEDRVEEVFEWKLAVLREAKPLQSDKPIVKEIEQRIDELKDFILRHEDEQKVIKRALQKALISEFYFEISPKHTNLPSRILFSEGENKIFDIVIEQNIIQDLNLYDLFAFNDVTFIETPILLQMYDVISQSATLFEADTEQEARIIRRSPKVSLHIKDLISKLENAQYFSTIYPENETPLSKLLEEIASTTQGTFSLQKEAKDFFFSKNKNAQIRSVNTASGIKAFGVIQLLLQANILNNRSLLIIDEPEIHLHPKWQVEYARVIVQLVRNGIPVLITSHSPYMIQALKVFSEKAQIQGQTNYYLAEKEEKEEYARIIDVTRDLNRIFKKLSDPLQNLVWS